MPKRRTRFLCRWPVLLSVAALICSCQQAQPRFSNDDGDVVPARPVADALDRETAIARKARISRLGYDAHIDIAASDEELVGNLRVSFELSDAAADLTLDFTGGTLAAVTINGRREAADYNGYFLTLPAEQLRAGANTVEISYRRPYGHDGTGLHRFVDPEDGLTYLHSYLWPYYANRLLPSFDQPNLKARFKLRVTAPKDWLVVSTSPGTAQLDSCTTRLWTFAETPQISTYIFSLHAGAYKVWSDNSGEVPLRLMARQSLAEYVAVDEWFELTQKGMTFYKQYFDIAYPFAKYDQLIVPEFNIGGMENVAAVTFTERYVQRQQSSRAEREQRASTILHELAHMWFGDLVTHDWWNGMWLNESFATQMATLALAATTEFTDMWHGYFTDSKKSAYHRDSRVTTHPIEMPVDSTDMFTTLFDAITYEKGGSVLKQLQFRVGAENYRRGVSAYLKEHAYGTSELADFIRHQGEASGLDLRTWSEEWLLTPGFNTFAAEAVCEAGTLRSIRITQSAPKEWPTLRSHKTKLALYSFGEADELLVGTVLPITIDSARAKIAVPGRQPCPVLINPNFEDWSYAKIAISDSDELVLGKHLAHIRDPLSRSMFLAALFDKAMAGEMPLAAYARQALHLADTEQNFRVLAQIAASLSETVNLLQRLRPETDQALAPLLRDIESRGLKNTHFAATQDLKQLWFGLFLDVASSDAAMGTIQALLDAKADIDGIEISQDVRWRLLQILSREDAPGVAERLAQEIRHDASDFGETSLLTARALAPSAAKKEHWLDELQLPQVINNLAKQRALMSGLFPASQTRLQLELLTKILGALPQMSRDADSYFLSSYATELLTPMCRSESSALMRATLDEFSDQLNPTALRFLREAEQADVECLALRERLRF